MHESRSIDQERGDRGNLGRRIRERATQLGFDVVGFARCEEPLGVEHERYLRFVEKGMHGDMEFLAELAEQRRTLDGEALLAGARSVICVGMRYARSGDELAGISAGIARYARGRDYHNFLRKRLRKLAKFVRTLTPEAEARALCDVEPVLERAWAVRAGLGFVGKNGMVITPGQGSYQMLGEVVTNLVLPAGTPMNERCGSCTRCLDACPTAAFVEPFVLDARRCVSYLTIEARGAPAEELREAVGERYFGCDDCQEVCPFNRTAEPEGARTVDFAPVGTWQERGLGDMVAMDEATFDEVTLGSPLRRAKRAGLARNAALVAANRVRGGKGTAEDEAVLRAALAHDEAAVREVAEWGLAGRAEGAARSVR